MNTQNTKIDRQHRVFLNIAKEIATLSHCVSWKVGCVAVLDNRILATGINGSPKGAINCDQIFDVSTVHDGEEREAHHQWSKIHEIHAEMNTILFCAKHGISLEGATLYCTLQPCAECTKNLIQSGVKAVVYGSIYDKNAEVNDELRELLENSEIEIVDKFVERTE